MQQPQQGMATNMGNMSGYGNMPPNPGMMGAASGMPQNNMPNNPPSNNGNMRGQGMLMRIIREHDC